VQYGAFNVDGHVTFCNLLTILRNSVDILALRGAFILLLLLVDWLLISDETQFDSSYADLAFESKSRVVAVMGANYEAIFDDHLIYAERNLRAAIPAFFVGTGTDIWPSIRAKCECRTT